jgi:hypothetical protein
VAVVWAGLSVLAGCAGQDHSLPQVGGGSSPSPTVADPAAEYQACMTAAGLPIAWLGDNTGWGLLELDFSDTDTFIYQRPDGTGGSSRTVDSATLSAFDAADTAYRLAVNGADRSEDYQHCHDVSLYDEAAASGQTTGIDPEQLNDMMAASLDWAACARQSGWPQTADPKPATGDTPPIVLLPDTMTEEQLRQLLDSCPMEPWTGETPATEIWPTIGFDRPGFDGDWEAFPTTPDPDEQRLIRMMETIYEVAGQVVIGPTEGGPPT